MGSKNQMKISLRYTNGLAWSIALFSYGIAKPLLILVYFAQAIYVIKKKIKLTKLSCLLFIYIACWLPYIVIIGEIAILSNYIAFFLGFIFYFSIRDNSDYFLKAVYYLSVFACLDACYQFMNGVDVFGIPLYADARATGPFTWPSPVIGSYVAILFFLPSILLKSKPVRLSVQFLFLVTILISGNRSCILQIMTVGFLFSSNSTRILIISFVTSVFLLYDEVLMFFDLTALLRVIELFSVEDVIALESDPGRRLHMWLYLYQNLDIMTLLFGTGVGASELYIDAIYPFGYLHPHHLYLELFYNLGLLGLSLLILQFASSYLKFNREQRRNLLLFWGPFNMLHSINDLFWLSMLIINLIIVYHCRTDQK